MSANSFFEYSILQPYGELDGKCPAQ